MLSKERGRTKTQLSIARRIANGEGRTPGQLEMQDKVRAHKERLTDQNKKDLQALQKLLDGNKIIIATSGELTLELIDGSIGNDRKGDDKVGVNLKGPDTHEQYRIYPWGLDLVHLPQHISEIGIQIQGVSYSAGWNGYQSDFCAKSADVVRLVERFLQSGEIMYYHEAEDYRREVVRKRAT